TKVIQESATKRHKIHKRIFCDFCASLWLIPYFRLTTRSTLVPSHPATTTLMGANSGTWVSLNWYVPGTTAGNSNKPFGLTAACIFPMIGPVISTFVDVARLGARPAIDP